jgi:beta-lactamase regulating signal transducer with metallopeptidase domain
MHLETLSMPKWVLDCSLQGSISILVILALVPLVRRAFGAQAVYLFWAVAILHLLVPWLPATPLHWAGPVVHSQMDRGALLLPGAKTIVSIVPGYPAAPAPDVPAGSAVVQPTGGAEMPVRPFPWSAVAFSLWMSGVIAILGYSAARVCLASRLAHRARDISDYPLLSGLLESFGAGYIRIRETGELRSPALTGFLRPLILLPLDWQQKLSADQIRYVLLHEVGHLRRGDLIWRWAFLIARAVHWFNPLVWIAERIARTDQEMACDEWVLEREPVADSLAYGEALIASAQKLSSPVQAFPVQAGMAESYAGLKRRIRHIAGARPQGGRAIAVCVILSATLLVLTGPVRSQISSPSGKETATPQPVVPSSQPDHPAKEEAKQMASATPTKKPKPLNVQIASKFLEISTDEVARLLPADLRTGEGATAIRPVLTRKQFQELIQSMNSKSGADWVSVPTVTTRSGQKCIINIVREFRYPTRFEQSKDGKAPATPTTFGTRDVGVTLTAEPTVTSSGELHLTASSEATGFQGFIDFGGSRAGKGDTAGDPLTDAYQASGEGVINQPIFASRRIRTSLTLSDGETIVLGGLTSSTGGMEASIFGDGRNSNNGASKALFVFVTATIIAPDGQPLNGPHSKSSIASPLPPAWTQGGGVFYAFAVPGKPGFVKSPYAPAAGYIDVRGYPYNAEAEDPYTGQMFLVPPPEGEPIPEPQPDPASPLGKAMRIVIPSVEFKDADLGEALDILRTRARELDSESDPTKKGINLVLKLPGKTAATRKISAQLRNISLLEALRFVAATNDLVVDGEAYALSIQPADAGSLLTREYRVPASLLPGLQATKPSDMRSFWMAHGIDSPPGSGAAFHAPDKLVLHNTREWHVKMQQLLDK